MALPGGDTKGWGATIIGVTTTKALIPLSSHSRAQILKNTGISTVFLGGSDITSANTATDAYPLGPNEQIAFASDVGGDSLVVGLYCVMASGTGSLAVMRGDV